MVEQENPTSYLKAGSASTKRTEMLLVGQSSIFIIHRCCNMASWFIRRFSIASLIFLVLVTGASAIFVYLVSPLRDPAFQPNSGNAGSLVWWLQGVPEGNWLLAAAILAGLLAINSMLVLWYLRIARQITMLMLFGFWMWLLLYYLFLFHLTAQWLVD
ncbi:MAG: hypothetical protein ICV63_05945 [Coleofasciculus sp. Co-bin14]|nr:hypothetical protein [Coleofasciculus sp. Co-bin14]